MTKLHYRYFSHFYNSEYRCSIDILCQNSAKITSSSGAEVDFVIYVIFSNVTAIPNFTSPVMLNVKFEIKFYRRKSLNICFHLLRRTTHDARRTHWYGNSSLRPFGSGEGDRVARWCWVNFQCRGVLPIWIRIGQKPTALAVGAGGGEGCLDIFISRLSFLFSFSLSLEDGPI